jgi:hypothetical protein
MKITRLFVLVLLASLLTGCAFGNEGTKTGVSESGNFIVEVDSKEADCVGLVPRKCLLVKKDGEDWKLWYAPIQGFNFEPGFHYTLEISQKTLPNPPADSSSIEYSLVKEIEKTAE